jgi:hypothetical protein
MFTSISRSSSRARPSYVCTSCLNRILASTDVQLLGNINGHRPFSATHGNQARKSSRGTPSKIPISDQKPLLDALKQNLIADTKQPPKKNAALASSTKGATPSKSTKLKPSSETSRSTEGAKSTKETKSTKNTKAKSAAEAHKLKKSAKATKSTKKSEAAESKEGEKLVKPITRKVKGLTLDLDRGQKFRKALLTRRVGSDQKLFSQKPPAPATATSAIRAPRIIRSPSGDAGATIILVKESVEKFEARVAEQAKHTTSFKREDRYAEQNALLKVIESGNLSQDDTKEAVQQLRATLKVISRVPIKSGPVANKAISSLDSMMANNIAAYQSLKDGIQGKALKTQDFKTPKLNKAIIPLKKPVIRKHLAKDGSSRTRGAIATPRMKSVRIGPMKGKGFEVKKVAAADLQLFPIERAQEPVPKLSYGLERVLFNPGVYHLQDPRSRVFNFDPYLQTIMPVKEFDFNALKQYITSSRDGSLLDIAKELKKKYTGSTSSMTAALAHFHFLLSQWRPVNTGMLSQNFPVEFDSFTALQRGPSAIFLRYKDGTYAIDADKQYDTANILSMLGKSMEKFLTLPTEGFEKYRRENSDQISAEERNEAETFHYTTMGDFLMRSQLDAHDHRLPGTGMFDLKTRAVVSIRMDVSEYEQGMGYEIRGRHGEWESYEREYYDMIRAAFLKYSLQVRMGRMDGIFVAFHNTERIFGFQYISLPEMDYALHGTDDTTIGDSEFKLSLELLNQALDRATEKYPEKSLRLHFETRGDETPFMYIFAEPMEEAQIDDIQASNRAAILEFEENVLGMSQKSEEELLELKRSEEWDTLRAKVEESMEKDELDVMEARSFAENVMRESKYWDDLSPAQKETCIDELLDSIASGEGETGGQNEGVPVDNEEEDDGETEDEGDSMDENDNDEAEGEEEWEDSEEERGDIETSLETGDGASREIAEESITDDADLEEGSDINAKEQPSDIEAVEDNSDEIEEVVDPDTEVDQSEQVDVSQADVGDDEPPVDVEPALGGEPLFSDEALDGYIRAKIETIKEEQDEPTAKDHPLVSGEESESSSAYAEADNSKTSTPANSSYPDYPLEVPTEEAKEESKVDVMTMTLTIRNLVNGEYVERPHQITKDDKWTVEYALVTVPDERGRTVYEACKKRRRQALTFEKKESVNAWNNKYLENLRRLSQKGRVWRADQNEIDAADGMKRLDLVDGQKVELKDAWNKPENKDDE